ncbi:hypothetical protein KR200_000267 [Drosophila serrata]|nr:hypothetical protein KR200_000267 [Drosophila serrata]
MDNTISEKSEKAQETIQEKKSVAASIEGSLGGAKEAHKKSVEKPRGTMPRGEKAQEADSEVDDKTIADTSAKKKKEVEHEAIAEKSVAATIEGALGGAKEGPKKSAPGTKVQGAESDVDVKPIFASAKIKKEVEPYGIVEKSMAATIGGALGGAKEDPKKSAPGTKVQGAESDVDVKPIFASAKIKKEVEPYGIVEKSVAATTGQSLGGAKNDSKKSAPGTKVQGAESDVDVKPIFASAKVKKEVEPYGIVEKSVAATTGQSLGGAKNDSKKSTEKARAMVARGTTSGKPQAQSDVDIKRTWTRCFFESDDFLEDERPKKIPKNDFGFQFKIHREVARKLNLMPKPVVEPEFIETGQRQIKTMNRRELEDLVMHMVTEKEKARSEFNYIKAELFSVENTLAIYRRKITEVSNLFGEMQAIGKRDRYVTDLVRKTPAAGQNVNGQSHAAGSMCSPSSVTFPTVRAWFEKSEGPAPTRLIPFRSRGYAIVNRSSFGLKQGGSQLARTKEEGSSMAASKPIPKTESIQANDRLGQDASEALKENDQPGGESQASL